MTSESAQNANPHYTENRRNVRLDIEVPASIELPDGTHVYGSTSNVSFSGAYLLVDDPSIFEADSKAIFSLILQEQPVLEVISFKCKVVHVGSDGLGLKFLAVFAEHYNDFVFLMVNNSPEPNELLDELDDAPGIRLHSNE